MHDPLWSLDMRGRGVLTSCRDAACVLQARRRRGPVTAAQWAVVAWGRHYRNGSTFPHPTSLEFLSHAEGNPFIFPATGYMNGDCLATACKAIQAVLLPQDLQLFGTIRDVSNTYFPT